MKKLSVAYFGTPELSARFLEKILSDKNLPLEVKLVVTQPDRKIGRKQVLTPSPVKALINSSFARSHSRPSTSLGAPLIFDESLAKSKLTRLLSGIDLGLLLFFGEIIPQELLNLPRYGFWNIHFSLLPKYKGGAPYAQAIINGDRETGITIFKMDERLDHGPVILQKKVSIKPKERANELASRLTNISFEMLKRIITKLQDTSNKQGPIINLQLKQQDHTKETFTKLLTKEDGFVEISNFKAQMSNQAEELFNLFRGLYPWPGIWTLLRSFGATEGQAKRLKITDMDLIKGKLMIKKVQLEGKKEVDFKQFNQVYKVF